MLEKYCPMCGGVLKEMPWEDDVCLPTCMVCGYEFYQNSKPCVVALIVDRDKQRILLTKRGIVPFKGDWDMPGGFLRDGEDPKVGVMREVEEELSVPCEVERLFDIFVDTYGEFDVYTFNVCYTIRLLSDDIKPMDDVAEAKWFDFDDIPENMAFNFLGDIIDRLRAEMPTE
jgi:8-oxo-dGTP diphosphatase